MSTASCVKPYVKTQPNKSENFVTRKFRIANIFFLTTQSQNYLFNISNNLSSGSNGPTGP
jgi:hypothetical protein